MFKFSTKAALFGLTLALVPAAVPAAGAVPSTTPPATTPVSTTPVSTTPVSTTPVATTPSATPVPPTTPSTDTPTPTTPVVPTPDAEVPHTSEAHAATEILVRFKPTMSTALRNALIAKAGADLDYVLPLDDVELVDVESGSVANALAWMQAQPGVVWAEQNTMVTAAVDLPYGQGDPFFPKQWGIANYGNEGRVFDADIDALESWVVTKGAGAVVGVVDTGVDSAHPDLAGKLVEGANFVPDGHSTTADGSGHGTHVTGIISALENSIGIVGAAPGAKVETLRALDDNGAGTSATIASAFAFAGKEGLRVVNASLGSSAPSRAVSDAIAASPDTLFVVAAGNAGVNVDTGGGANYPCQFDLPNVLCVGASDDQDRAASFSNRGATSVDLFAPGASIISTAPGNAYRYESGTSMAAPFAAAVAAEVVSIHPTWSAAQVKRELMATVDQPAALAGLSVTGGRVNAARAVGLYAGPDGARPGAVTGLVGTAGVGKADLSWQPAASSDLALYQVERLVNGGWTQQAVILVEAGQTSLSITGLAPGVPQSYRVRAIDRSGEEGDASAPVVVTPTATAAEAPKTSTATGSTSTTKTTKSATKSSTGASSDDEDADADEVASTKKAILSAVKRAKAKGKVSGLTFRLSSSSAVTVTAVPVRKKAAAQSVITKTFKLAAGASRVKFGGGSKAIKLTKGTWKITLATKASSVSLKVAVR